MEKKILAAMNGIEVLDSAKEETKRALAAKGVLHILRKGHILFRDKEEVQSLYIVVSGFVSLYKIDEQGEKKVIFVLGQGKLINEAILQGMTASVSCEVLELAKILSFRKADFLMEMEHDFDLTKAVITSLSTKIRRLYRQMKNTTSSLRGDKKLAAKLWKLSGDFGKEVSDGSVIGVEISITYLADMLGTKRETVSRQLKVLTGLGLVYLQDNYFMIPSREKLAQYFKTP